MISTTIFIRIMTSKLFVFSFLVLLTSCGLPYVHKVQLTKDDLSWIDHYHDTDTLVFTSNMVRSSVINDLKRIGNIPVGKPVNRIINVSGDKLQYTVFKRLENGEYIYNIGRIHGI